MCDEGASIYALGEPITKRGVIEKVLVLSECDFVNVIEKVRVRSESDVFRRV